MLSNFACFGFNCNMRLYSQATDTREGAVHVYTRTGATWWGGQVDPGFSQLTPRLLSALETKYDGPLSNFAFKCNMRHYNMESAGHPHRL